MHVKSLIFLIAAIIYIGLLLIPLDVEKPTNGSIKVNSLRSITMNVSNASLHFVSEQKEILFDGYLFFDRKDGKLYIVGGNASLWIPAVPELEVIIKGKYLVIDGSIAGKIRISGSKIILQNPIVRSSISMRIEAKEISGNVTVMTNDSVKLHFKCLKGRPTVNVKKGFSPILDVQGAKIFKGSDGS